MKNLQRLFKWQKEGNEGTNAIADIVSDLYVKVGIAIRDEKNHNRLWFPSFLNRKGAGEWISLFHGTFRDQSRSLPMNRPGFTGE